MTTCQDLCEALYEFTAQELPAERHCEMCQHRDCCPKCAALVETYQITIRLARLLPPVPMPPACLARLHVAVATYLGPQ